ncbi:hypothetical protein P4O66_002363 [Electrophorus voltai]|uniref:Acyl-coenzyme A thioesterase 11 n=1 Tax=Electrophorus voltai TaxID=2609070 RepID=A0AAD9DSD3_9TELE|nr:hypothetical protein P4O66_002363 [Electrophorus voltai]
MQFNRPWSQPERGLWAATYYHPLSAMASGSKPQVEQGDSDLVVEDDKMYRNPTEVKMSQIVLPCHANHRKELSVGQLLKWMDCTACLSVLDRWLTLRQKLTGLSTQVGIEVSCEDLYSNQQWKVCHAFATFVARSTRAEKICLKPLVPCTHKEQLEYSMAAERRRMRLLHIDIMKDLLSNKTFQWSPSEEGQNEQLTVPTEKTRVESVELVLPPHANHQVNTFGGQIMAWMENVATIAASRLCNAHPTLRTIDMFHFRGPSQVGDRLVLKAIVNNTFKNSMEVGVCAEAYQGEESQRHINSAFMMFEVLDEDGKPCPLPPIRPEPLDGSRRYQEAIARKKIRLDRSVADYVTKNVFMLHQYAPMEPHVYVLCRQCELIIQVNDDDFIYHVLTPSVSEGGKVQDFILLASRRPPCNSGDPYVIALRSVTLPTHPPTEDFNRGEMLCAGFIIYEVSKSVSKISYYNQTNPGVLPYISTDIAGLSSSFCYTFHSCSQYLLENRTRHSVLSDTEI